MSFFNDFFKYFNIGDIDSKTTITTILGYGTVVVGKIKIKNISDSEIYLISSGKKILFTGNGLEIKSISKGELVIAGDIQDIKMEKL